ncbi:helix-turn-helix domain-containing protein [Halalkalibacter oceani]|uniref:helix-turn-helix domain-containing protein n=1 Tax=Halalkalibacter oceani TaxID=1653776 RepID=UPI003D81640D
MDRIKVVRQHRKVSVKEISNHLGISTSAYYAKERGARATTIDELETICIYLDFPPYYLYQSVDAFYEVLNNSLSNTMLAFQ